MTAPLPPAPQKRARTRRLVAPLLLGAIVWLIALAALLHGTRGEAEARRNLTLRTAEVLSWLGHDVATSSDRIGFAREGGPSDSAPAWRDVLAAAEEAAAIALSDAPRLPSLSADARLATSLRAATDARRFTAFNHPEEMVDDPWPRRARVFGRMLGNGLRDPADRVPWLAGAIAFASDLRSVATLEHGVVAAEIDAAIVARLGDAALAPADATRLADLLDAARRRLPVAGCLANRETRLLQATVCALADVAPLRGGRLRSDDEPPLPLLQADDAVARLDRLPPFLTALLSGTPDAATLRDFTAWRDAFAGDLPRVAPLLPTSDAVAATATAANRLDRLVERVRNHASGPAAR